MKKEIFLWTFLFLLYATSCRHSAGWHLKKAIEKQPDIVSCDTIINNINKVDSVVFDTDTILTVKDSIIHDTIINQNTKTTNAPKGAFP